MAKYMNFDGRFTELINIGEVSTPPYEYLWDCSNIPDQDFNKLLISCMVYDKAGNVAEIPDWRINQFHNPPVILDRNPEHSNNSVRSYYISGTITIDGDLGEWAPRDSVEITNNDNRLVLYTVWDNNNVYFGIRVEDQSIVSHFDENSDNTGDIPIQDIVELYIDGNHDHDEFRSRYDVSYLLSPAGNEYKRIAEIVGGRYISKLYTDVNCKIITNGTINTENDSDTCYVIEIAVPWSDLGSDPDSAPSMGLEIWNSDKDYVDGEYFYAGWTTIPPTLNNPSEWGDILFVKETNSHVKTALLVVTALVFATAGAVTIKVRRSKHTELNDDKQISIEKQYIIDAMKYVEENYSDETITRDTVARYIGLTPTYFGKIFKKETGRHFPEYLTSVRIMNAKILLSGTSKTISEIAYEVGFNSHSYFGCIFKKSEHETPKGYRVKHKHNC